MIKIVNKNNHTPTPVDFYIGRGSPLGNPYTSLPVDKTKALIQCGCREESIDLYQEWLQKKLDQKDPTVCTELNRIYTAAKKCGVVYLVCYCAPKLCHGEVIKQMVESKLY